MASHIFCISGPEGVGKDTLLARILQEFPQLTVGRKATTRDPRDDDYDDEGNSKYVYLSFEEFMLERTAGRIVEHSQNATGGYYGSYVDLGVPCIEIRELDVNGAMQLYAKSRLIPDFPGVTLLGIVPPFTTRRGSVIVDLADSRAGFDGEGTHHWASVAGSGALVDDMLGNLRKRLAERGDPEERVEQKLARAQWEIPEILGTWPNPHIIVNDDLDVATQELIGVVRGNLSMLVV